MKRGKRYFDIKSDMEFLIHIWQTQYCNRIVPIEKVINIYLPFV